MTIYVRRSFDRAFEFTSDKEDAQDFVHKRLAVPTLRTAAAIKAEYRWDLIPSEQTSGTVYVVAGELRE
ncbi:MAG TPA: hypothetical protein VNO32_09250 [Candidatus Acidoferrum sp.]|nr:hypothetical protein [Candidatus Acidoferrum sp.]